MYISTYMMILIDRSPLCFIVILFILFPCLRWFHFHSIVEAKRRQQNRKPKTRYNLGRISNILVCGVWHNQSGGYDLPVVHIVAVSPSLSPSLFLVPSGEVLKFSERHWGFNGSLSNNNATTTTRPTTDTRTAAAATGDPLPCSLPLPLPLALPLLSTFAGWRSTNLVATATLPVVAARGKRTPTLPLSVCRDVSCSRTCMCVCVCDYSFCSNAVQRSLKQTVIWIQSFWGFSFRHTLARKMPSSRGREDDENADNQNRNPIKYKRNSVENYPWNETRMKT